MQVVRATFRKYTKLAERCIDFCFQHRFISSQINPDPPRSTHPPRSTQIHPDPSRSTQIHPDPSRFIHIHPAPPHPDPPRSTLCLILGTRVTRMGLLRASLLLAQQRACFSMSWLKLSGNEASPVLTVSHPVCASRELLQWNPPSSGIHRLRVGQRCCKWCLS